MWPFIAMQSRFEHKALFFRDSISTHIPELPVFREEGREIL